MGVPIKTAIDADAFFVEDEFPDGITQPEHPNVLRYYASSLEPAG